MELRHVRYFLAVARRLNFTRAAEDLNISQPPLSRQIRELEEEIGVPLFDRSEKRTALTPAGAYFLIEAERLLAQAEAACAGARAVAGRGRPLRIGCASFWLTTLLAPLLDETDADPAEVRPELVVMPTEAQVKAIRSGALDLGFVRSWAVQDDLAYEPMADQALALIFPRDDGFPSEAAACAAALADRPFIGISRTAAPGLADAIAEAAADLGAAPRHAYECAETWSAVGMVAAGLGWAIVPYADAGTAADGSARVGSRPLPRRIAIGACYRTEAMSARSERFLRRAKALFRAAADGRPPGGPEEAE
jgi:DNA-binding transcriptional LysR family regulator